MKKLIRDAIMLSPVVAFAALMVLQQFGPYPEIIDTITLPIFVVLIGFVPLFVWGVTFMAALEIKEKERTKERLLWIALIVFTNIIGSYIFYFVEMRKKPVKG